MSSDDPPARRPPAPSEPPKQPPTPAPDVGANLVPPLDDSGRRELNRIARVTLREFLRSGKLPPGAPHKKALRRRSGKSETLFHAGGGSADESE